MLKLLIMFCVQVIAYVILVLNLRALNRGKYTWTGITEFAYAMMNFWVFKRMVEAQTLEFVIIYATGATVGSLTAMWVTKHWE